MPDRGMTIGIIETLNQQIHFPIAVKICRHRRAEPHSTQSGIDIGKKLP